MGAGWGTGWKMGWEGRRLHLCLASLSRHRPAGETRCPRAGLCKKRTWGLPGTRASLESQAICFVRQPHEAAARLEWKGR